MINIKELQNRLDWLNSNLPILQQEKEALTTMLKLYNSSEYHSLRSLQQDLSEPPVMIEKVKAATASPKVESKKEIISARIDGTYTTKKFFKYCNDRPGFAAFMHACTKDYQKLLISSATAKEFGMSSDTLSKLLKTAVQRGWLRKHNVLKATYAVPLSQVQYLKKHLPKEV